MFNLVYLFSGKSVAIQIAARLVAFDLYIYDDHMA